MEEFLAWLLPILLLCGVVALYFLLSGVRERRVQKHTVPYVEAFAELCAHVLGEEDYRPGLRSEGMEGAKVALPMERQPEAVQRLFREKPDERAVELLRTLYRERDEAQSLLMSHNLIEKKYNLVLNYSYELAETLLLCKENVSILHGKKRIDAINTILLNRDKLFHEMFPTILPKNGSDKQYTEKR